MIIPIGRLYRCLQAVAVSDITVHGALQGDTVRMVVCSFRSTGGIHRRWG